MRGRDPGCRSRAEVDGESAPKIGFGWQGTIGLLNRYRYSAA
jgi:hypothetical protein